MTARLVVVGLACLVGVSQSAAQSSGSPLLERAKQYQAAMKAKDPAKVASFYADEAVSMPPNHPPLKGVKAIEENEREMLKRFPDMEVTITPLASEVAGDLGYVRGTFVTLGNRGQRKGSYVEVWKRLGGEWKILYDIWNSSEPSPAPPKPPTPPVPPTPNP